MRESVRHQLLIASIAALVFFTNLGSTRLWDQDEAFFARTAVEMQQRHEWIVPYFNGELFAHKPPLMFWMMRLGFAMFGQTEFAARFWSAVFGILTALVVYRLGRRMFNARVGLYAGLAMPTAVMFGIVSGAATPDGYLVFFCTLALYLFVRHERWENSGEEPKVQSIDRLLSLGTSATIYAAMGVAVLVKGPIGVLLPGCTIGLYLLFREPIDGADRPKTWSQSAIQFARRFSVARITRTIWSMRPITAMVAVLCIAGPWYFAVGVRTHGEFWHDFFGTQNVARFLSPMDNHGGGIWYYIPAILVGFFPWSIFAVPMVVDLIQRCRGKEPWQQGATFLACWIAVFVGFFSLASTKLPNYVLPAYPALALAVGCFIDRWATAEPLLNRWWMRCSLGSMLLVGGIAAIGSGVIIQLAASGNNPLAKFGVDPEITSDLWLIFGIGAILLIGATACLSLVHFRRRTPAIVALVATNIAFMLALGFSAMRFDRFQPSPAVAEVIHQYGGGEPHVAQFGYFRPSLVYYTNTRVEQCKTPRAVAEFLEQSPDAFVVTTEEHYPKIAAELSGGIVVLDRKSDFPRNAKVVVLGRKTELAKRDDAVKQ